MKHIVIIGSGLAGYTLAREFRNLDKTSQLTIITQDDGRFYSKPMLSNALAQNKDPDTLAMGSAEKMSEQLNAKILNHQTVTAIDNDAKTVQTLQQSIHYDELILAYGAHVITPPITGIDSANVYSVNNLTDFDHFYQAISGKKHIAIIGAGLIGCEFANDLISAGYQVSVIAMGDYPMDTFLPEKPGKKLQEKLQQLSVKWYFNDTVNTISSTAEGCNLSLASGKSIDADLVLSAIGIKADLSLAQSIGLDCNQGIITDEYLQTSMDDIYALGDCAEVAGFHLQYITPIMRTARALAKTLAGDKTPVTYPVMPVVVKTPVCPLVFHLPINNDGQWQYDVDDENGLKALFYDAQNKLQGFILMGECIKERMMLCKQLPDLIG